MIKNSKTQMMMKIHYLGEIDLEKKNFGNLLYDVFG